MMVEAATKMAEMTWEDAQQLRNIEYMMSRAKAGADLAPLVFRLPSSPNKETWEIHGTYSSELVATLEYKGWYISKYEDFRIIMWRPRIKFSVI